MTQTIEHTSAPARDGDESPERRERVTRRSLARAAIGLVLVLLPLAGATSASARDANCTRVTMSDPHRITKYLPYPGWGTTVWTVTPTVVAYDRCNHGSLRVATGINGSAVSARGGRVLATAVHYQTSSSSTWRPLRYNASQDVFMDPGHLDLTRTSRITRVRVQTAVYGQPRGSMRVVLLATGTTTCNLVRRTCD